MSPTGSISSTPVRPWLFVLVAVLGALVVAGAWWAGQRVEQKAQAEQVAEAPVSARTAVPAASAAASSVLASGTRPRSMPPAMPASAATLTAELSPLPWPFWEYRLRQPLPPRTPPLVPPPWRMIGATQSASGWSLVVLRQGRTAPEFFKVGESLPGGYRVAAISQDDVTLESGGRSVVLSFIGTR